MTFERKRKTYGTINTWPNNIESLLNWQISFEVEIRYKAMASRNVPSSSMREDDGEDDEVVSFTTKMKPKPLVAYGDRMPFRGGNN